MFKKTGVVFLICLMFLGILPAKVSAKSIEDIGDLTSITNNGPRVLIEYEGQPAYVYYGSSGISISMAEETRMLETFFEVLKLEPVGDVNGDSYCDFLTYQKAPEFTEQLMLVSGKDGKVLNSLRLTRMGYSDDLGNIENNVYIQQIYDLGDKTALIVYDYTILRIDLTSFEIIWSYSETDNIWKAIKLSDGTIAYCGQQNNIGQLDYESGTLLNRINPCPERMVSANYDNTRQVASVMNIWDIRELNGEVLALSEEGFIYRFSFGGGDPMRYQVGQMDDETFTQSLQNRLRWSEYGIYYNPTNITEWQYGGFRFDDVKDNLYLIDCYTGDLNCASQYSNSMYPSAISIWDSESGEVVTRLSIENFSCLYLKNCFGEYEGETCICVVTGCDKDKIRLALYNLNGELLYLKELNVSLGSDSSKIALSYNDGKYLMEVLNSGCLEISGDLKSYSYCYSNEKNTLLTMDDEGILLVYTDNGMKYKVAKYDRSLENVLWTRSIDTKDNKGYEFIRTDLDFNGDKVNDVVTIKHTYKDDVAYRSDIIIYSGKDGTTLKYNPYVTNTYYENYVKKYTYMIFREADLFRDIDGDGVRELVLDGTVISSRTDNPIGSLSGYVDAEGNQYQVGDINGDGVTEIVVVSDKETRLYNSSVSYAWGYLSVEYKKTSSAFNNNQSLKQSMNSALLGDLNRDGIKEIGFVSRNDAGHETFVIVDGQKLKNLVVMYPDGIHDYNECVKILDQDLNGDGYNEIVGCENWNFGIYDGKTGTRLMSIARDYWADQEFEHYDKSYFPDYIVPFNTMVDESNFKIIEDVNGDGCPDLALSKMLQNEDNWRMYTVVRIHSGKDQEILKEIMVTEDYIDLNIQQVEGNNRFIAIGQEESLMIIDLNSLTVLANFDTVAKRVSGFDDNNLLIVNKDDKLNLINIEESFHITSDVPETTDDYIVHLAWQSLEDYSVMTISDNSGKVYSGTASEYDIKLAEGDHRIVLSMDDGQGKHYQKEVNVTVNSQPNNNQWLYGAVGGLAILGFLLGRFQKTVIKRRYKKEASR